jgi:hypothetical protein
MTTCPKLVESGVYVLGALPPGQRLEYERHLTTCAECRAEVGDLAVLPGLLGRLDEASVSVFAASAEPAPPSMLHTALGRLRKQRRVRRFSAFAGALAAAALAAFAMLLLPSSPVGPTVAGSTPSTSTPVSTPPTAVTHAMTPVGGEDKLAAEVVLTPTNGGTRLDVTCRYLGTRPPQYQGPPPRFSLFLVSVNGAPAQQVATWTALPGDTVTVPAMSWWRPTNIARVELRSQDGTTLLRYQA